MKPVTDLLRQFCLIGCDWRATEVQEFGMVGGLKESGLGT